MKTKSRRKTVEPVKHIVPGEAIKAALQKANIPQQYIRPAVTIDSFPWGEDMKEWMDGDLASCAKRGRCALIHGKPEESMTVCAMLTRTLVMRGHDAVFLTAGELIAHAEPPRQSEFLIIAGFYDDRFNENQGRPLSAPEAHKLSWELWRLNKSGTIIVLYVSPNHNRMGNWWHEGALTDMLDTTKTLTIH